MKLFAAEPAPLGKVSQKDVFNYRALLSAIITGGLGAIASVVLTPAAFFTLTTLQMFGGGAVIGLLGYVGKQLGTNSEGDFMKKEPRQLQPGDEYYFIEDTATKKWLTKDNTWTSDPIAAKRFPTEYEAIQYGHLHWQELQDYKWEVTEHMDF